MMTRSDYMIQIKTSQSLPMKTMLESLKDIVTDVNFNFTKKGFKILAIDGTKTALVHMFLYAGQFEKYHCDSDSEEGINLGINVEFLFRLIKPVTNNDILTLFVEKQNPNVLGIKIQSVIKHTETIINYRILDIDEDQPSFSKDIEMEYKVTMPSTELLSVCRSMNNVGKIVQFICCDDQFSIKCEGDCATIEKKFFESEGNIHLNMKDDTKIIDSRYSLNFIYMFTKATGLSSRVNIMMAKEKFLVVKYDVAKLGVLKFLLSPMNI